MKHVAAILLALSWAGVSLASQASSFAQVTTAKIPVSPQTAIVSVTPTTLSLRQGGTPATVTVAGKYLENVLSVQVTKAGQSASGMTAKLVAPWPSSGKIEIQAGTGASVSAGYQLRAMVKAGTSQTAIDVPQTVFSLAVAGNQLTAQPGPVGAPQTQPQVTLMMPDLIVEAVRIDPPNPTVGGDRPRFNVYATIKNQGTKEAFLPRGWCLAYSGIEGPGCEFLGRPSTDNTTIARGSSLEIRVMEYSPIRAGTYTLTVKADPQGQIAESNEKNNEKSIPVTVEGGQGGPGDLVITSLSLDRADATTEGNFKVVVVVKNQGGSALTYPNVAYFLKEEGDHIIAQSLAQGTWQPGESREFRCTPQKLQVGTFTWTMKVDAVNQVAEADENNNTKTMQITVH